MVLFDVTDEHTQRVIGKGQLRINSRSINVLIDCNSGLVSYVRLDRKSSLTVEVQLRRCWGLPRRYCVSLFDALENAGIPSAEIEKRKVRPFAREIDRKIGYTV